MGKPARYHKKTLIQSIDKGGLKLWQFSTKVKSLKLAWIKRLINLTLANWKVLLKYYLKCSNLDTYFSANHKPIITTVIPIFYNDIHSLYMKYFKQEPRTIKDISNQSLWLNKYITNNNKLIY